MSTPNPVHDPQVLRAIAHPVRNRILGELNAQGSMRAADIARDLDIPANQASFHLRQLAKYGLVEEDPAAARDKRDRAWRVAHDGGLQINLERLEEAPGGKAAAAVFRRNAAGWGHVVVDHMYAAHEPGTHRSVNETTLRLTTDEAHELSAALSEVIDRFSTASRAAVRDRPTDERRTYLYYGAILPYPGPGVEA